MAATPRLRSRIPAFGSIEEEAEFWDTHDSTEFEDEFEPVEFEVAPDFRSVFTVTVDLDRQTWDRLRAYAREQNIPLSDLARDWMLDGFGRAVAGKVSTGDRND